jgi:2-polyprenyl-3-methyl-5-hydroxy-6-metoxy-1,4-benzoquinol methylase
MMHSGKVLVEKNGFKVIDCKACGFKHLDPIPSEEEMDDFYKNKYFYLIEKSERAPEIKRLMKNDTSAKTERTWLEKTLYSDVNFHLCNNLSKNQRSVCDIGCGTGDFLQYITTHGWTGIGVEPNQNGAESSLASGRLKIFHLTLDEFITSKTEYHHKFDAITLMNVLEHVPNPKKILEQVKDLLNPHHGVICIRVPNDFNVLQDFARKKVSSGAWWVAIPDHINYFSKDSLSSLFSSVGFKTISATTDFPMEQFLLMGENYVDNLGVGEVCHKKRKSFELGISDEVRRGIYDSYAGLGIGRTCLVFGKPK